MKKYKYRNLVIFIILILFLSGVFIFSRFNVEDLLLKFGYYDNKITIMNTADVHGHITFEENSWGQYTTEDIHSIMGLPLVQGIVSKELSKNENVLFFDCGDMLHGTNEADINEGEPVMELANLMSYNALAVGSNDFNYGIERFVELSKESEHPYICANLYFDGERLFEPGKIFIVDNIKIGVFGLLTPDAIPDNDAYAKEHISISGPAQEAEYTIQQLKADGADVIVLLSHLGDINDVSLVKQVDGIDLIFSARRHNLYTTPVIVNDTAIVECGAWTTHVGKSDLYFRNNELTKIVWSLIATTDSQMQDEEMLELSDKYNAIALEASKQVVGYTEVELDGARTHMRTSETNFGNVLADAMRESGNADIALINGGAIRESIPEGEINQYQLSRALPFTNSLIVIESTGAEIKEAIERGLRAYPNGINGAFLQVSGISFTFDASRSPGSRIKEVLYKGEPMDPDETFVLATSDYLYYGGDNYSEFYDSPVVQTKGLLKEVMEEYLQVHGRIAPEQDGRIIKTGERYQMN